MLRNAVQLPAQQAHITLDGTKDNNVDDDESRNILVSKYDLRKEKEEEKEDCDHACLLNLSDEIDTLHDLLTPKPPPLSSSSILPTYNSVALEKEGKFTNVDKNKPRSSDGWLSVGDIECYQTIFNIIIKNVLSLDDDRDEKFHTMTHIKPKCLILDADFALDHLDEMISFESRHTIRQDDNVDPCKIQSKFPVRLYKNIGAPPLVNEQQIGEKTSKSILFYIMCMFKSIFLGDPIHLIQVWDNPEQEAISRLFEYHVTQFENNTHITIANRLNNGIYKYILNPSPLYSPYYRLYIILGTRIDGDTDTLDILYGLIIDYIEKRGEGNVKRANHPSRDNFIAVVQKILCEGDSIFIQLDHRREKSQSFYDVVFRFQSR